MKTLHYNGCIEMYGAHIRTCIEDVLQHHANIEKMTNELANISLMQARIDKENDKKRIALEVQRVALYEQYKTIILIALKIKLRPRKHKAMTQAQEKELAEYKQARSALRLAKDVLPEDVKKRELFLRDAVNNYTSARAFLYNGHLDSAIQKFGLDVNPDYVRAKLNYMIERGETCLQS